jgi:hypothetical protein
MTRQIVVACTLVVVSAVAVVYGQPNDLWLGTWKVNLTKSTFSSGSPFKSFTVKVEPAAGGAHKITFDGVNAQGQTTHSERVTKYDGTEVPVQAVQPSTNTKSTVIFRRIDDHTFEAVSKENGKVTTTTRVVTSPDGKTNTGTQTGTNAEGQAFKNVIVTEKQ